MKASPQGIAAIIALQQLPAALGVDVQAEKVLVLAAHAVSARAAHPVWVPAGPAVGVTLAIVAVGRVRPGLPASLIAPAAATAANSFLDPGAATISRIPTGLPAPRLPTIALSDPDALLLPAVAVAALAALESLLSATVADAMSVGHRHDSNRELVGQGLANLASPLFGGIPATAAIARTAVNIRAGATSRLASLTHAPVLLAVVPVAARWVSEIPLAALAGVLIATAIHMIRISSLLAPARSTRGDAAVPAITAGATVLFDSVTAVLLGLVVAGFVALQQTARTARLDEMPLDEADHTDEEQSLLDEHIVAYRIDGPLFFAAAHDFLLELADVSNIRVVILRMSRVTTIDATGAHVPADIVSRLEGRGVTVLLSGVQPAHEQVLRELGVYGHLAHERHLFDDTPAAITHARLHASRVTHSPAAPAE
ncbi:SulP family inorganic anion transporter [Nocardioides sp. B-3]|uniref:SulP family inorganic anion transporter n=1 Tax=Nocardioides sp. B-3 TaxID=2895565 RepID=UPI0021527D43|nr:SulP family inorganic anion transporter [Nocardioides sp. B-3]UUZ60907.1 STAS domain-containing protein [Nocardioides sp. B-3]